MNLLSEHTQGWHGLNAACVLVHRSVRVCRGVQRRWRAPWLPSSYGCATAQPATSPGSATTIPNPVSWERRKPNSPTKLPRSASPLSACLPALIFQFPVVRLACHLSQINSVICTWGQQPCSRNISVLASDAATVSALPVHAFCFPTRAQALLCCGPHPVHTCLHVLGHMSTLPLKLQTSNHQLLCQQGGVS